jgi:hypothetical protein
MPDLGGGVALARLLGPGRAADLILTARKLGADEALALGFANRVSAPGAARATRDRARRGDRRQRSTRGARRARDPAARHRLAVGPTPWPPRSRPPRSSSRPASVRHGITAVLGRATPRFDDPT